MKVIQILQEVTGAFASTIKHVWAPRDTVCYPEVKPDLPERWRGRIVLTRDPDGDERCVACYLCSSVCPANAITIQGAEREDERRYAKTFELDFSRCIFCGMCEEACPTLSIQCTTDFEMGKYSRDKLLYEKEDLLIDGTGKHPDFNYYKQAGVAITGKAIGDGENEKPPIDVYSLLP